MNGKVLVIPTADFKAVCIPFLVKFLLKANTSFTDGNDVVYTAGEEDTWFEITENTDVPKNFISDNILKLIINYPQFTISSIPKVSSAEYMELRSAQAGYNISTCFKGLLAKEIDISGLDCKIAGNIASVFMNCSELNKLICSKLYFQDNNVTNLSSMFANCINLKSIDFSDIRINLAPNVASGGMFQQCKKLTDINVKNVDSGFKSFLIKNLASEGYLFFESSDEHLLKVNVEDSGWNAIKASPDIEAMILWNNTGSQTAAGNYYVDGCDTYYFSKT